MADVHRKIELQEPEDLRYLVNNTRRAANEKLDEFLPRMEGKEDTYRQQVEDLVHEVRPLFKPFNSPFPSLILKPEVQSRKRCLIPPYWPMQIKHEN
jgi:hypothetical protein